MAVQKQDEEKLGTSVTYTDPNQSKQSITMGEVTFFPGEAVDLATILSEDRAKEMAKKLANNPAFKVEGGPDHEKVIEGRKKHEEEVAKKQQQAAERQQQEAQRGGRSQPPADWKGPDKPTLEHEAPSRRPK
jgi:hypothetical protein